jgi:HTH-type transcriptional regulator, transcriptional repressor of NAD biosynthesis genes
MTRGMVVGRFLPLHAGHVALIRTAVALVDRLTVILCWTRDEVPRGPDRLAWLAETFPAADIVAVEAQADHGGSGADWWPERIAALLPSGVDRLFASRVDQQPIAAALGAQFVLIDPAHEAVPVRSAELRADPDGKWDYLPGAVRPAYARTICLHGPESTGKSTLAPRLAQHYRTSYVPEYGRTYTEQFGRALDMADLVAIGRTHAALTDALLRRSNSRLILDTDPVMTAVWAEMLLGTRDPWFDAIGRTADLYLLLGIDVPFVDDGIRMFGAAEDRRRFFALSRAELDRRGLAYAVIDGPMEDRFDRALAAIAAAGL